MSYIAGLLYKACSTRPCNCSPPLPPQLRYLLLLFDLDGDGRVSPDDLVLGFEEIGTTIDTPANKVTRLG